MAGEFTGTVLGNLLSFANGRSSPERADGLPYPVYGSNGIIGHATEANTNEGSIIIGRVGSYCGSLYFSEQRCWVTDNAIRAAALDDNDPRFLFYLLGTLSLNNWRAGSGQPLLNQDILSRIPAAVPEPAEQRAIAHILGTLDDKIELNRRMNETLEAMARALFKSWFVDFDPVRAKHALSKVERAEGRPSASSGHAFPGLPKPLADLFPDSFEDSELGEIPRGWNVGKIKDCCEQIQNGGTPRRNERRYWDGGNIPWLGSGEVRQPVITGTERFITEAGLKESSAKWIPSYSTVVALYGATAGQVSIVTSPLTTNQAVCALIPKKNFALLNYLTMREATTALERKAVGSAQQNISKGIVEETRMFVPPNSVLERFAVVADSLLTGWVANLNQSGTLAALRDALLPKLLSGEVRVNQGAKFVKEAS